MKRRILILASTLVFALAFTGCGGNTAPTGDTAQTTAEAAAESGNDKGLEWPAEYMATLPVPDAKISGIDRLNGTDAIPEGDTTTKPTSVNVVMNEMTKAQAKAYYEALKSADITFSTDKNEGGKIQLVGTLNNEAKNPVLFNYIEEENFGNVTIVDMSVGGASQ